jgi:PAS domain S-box-containing protein
MPAGFAAAKAMLPDERTGIWPIGGLLPTTGPLLINELAGQSIWRDAPAEPEPVQQAMILPILGERREPQMDAVLVAGISPRLSLDQDHRDFLAAAAAHVGRGLANGRAYDEARGRTEALHGELTRLATLFHEAPSFLAVLRGPNHVFELANPTYRQLVGNRDVIGQPARQALPEVEGQGFFELLDGVYRTGEPFVGTELPMQLQPTPGGPLEQHFFNFVYQAMRTPEGGIWGILAAGSDVTAQVHARNLAELLATERDAERRRLLTVLEQSPLGIIIAEAPSGQWIYANLKFADVVGLDVRPEDVQSYSGHYRGFHADGRLLDSEDWPLARAIRLGEVVEQQTITIEHATGHRVEISVNAAPVRDAEGRTIAGVAFFRDVTIERRREQQLHHAQRLQSVGTLAGGVAHEINNQMTVVLNYTQFILEALGPDHPQSVDATMVLQAGRRAARTSNQLLAFTRRQIFQPRDIALTELTGELAPALRRLLGGDKTLDLLPARSALRVQADRGQIEQVLINLVSNARDATPTGGRVSIEVQDVALADGAADEGGFVIPPGDYVQLTVADNGHGMEAATLARVFEPFYTTKAPGKGTGLGLSMVYGIVKQHGGYIVARSTLGRGTQFKLYFPVR